MRSAVRGVAGAGAPDGVGV
uniref:Uncharacterized protein n=1 Tax=Arundo donax TaxID=35708 RepID=A0A0A9DYA1_ARUDO